jgi:ribonuclease BN (tRNA processing enzyme)
MSSLTTRGVGRTVTALAATSLLAPTVAVSQAPATQTQVVFLGTGTPRPDPERSGPATAIVVNGSSYLVDFGAGVVRRAVAAFDRGIKALAVEKLDIAFLTHMHSDHTVGYPDLIFTSWVHGRKRPLRVYGPPGMAAMTRHVLAAWQPDIDIRTKGFEKRNPAGAAVEAHDIEPGVVYRDSNVTVTAFPVRHGDVPNAFGYRFQTSDRVIVISGDASPTPALVDACRKCDVLIHEVFSEEYVPSAVPHWNEYRARFHTTTTQLAEIARKTEPGLLVLYHRGVRRAGGADISDEQYIAEIRRTYSGKVVVARDLDVY